MIVISVETSYGPLLVIMMNLAIPRKVPTDDFDPETYANQQYDEVDFN